MNVIKFRLVVMNKIIVLIVSLFLSANVLSKVEELDRIVAVVNKDIITLSELNAEISNIKQQLRSSNNQLPSNDILQKQILERLIIKRLQLEIAGMAGIKVTDDMLNSAVGDVAGQNKLSISELQQVLKKDGVSYTSFRENLRAQIIVQQLKSRQVINRITISDQEVDNFIENQRSRGTTHTEFHIGHILIATPEAASPEKLQAAKEKAMNVLDKLNAGSDFKQAAISYSDGQQALKGGDLGWRKSGELPTLFENVVAKMKSGATSKIIRSPSGYHIIKLIDARGSSTRVVTQTSVRHILIKPDELASEKDVKTRLQQLKDRIKDGDDFAALAKAHSDDKGSAVKGGSLGWMNPGDLVPQFEKVMKSSKVNVVSKPFKSPFGWHILQVLERRKHDSTQEYQRSQARQAIRNRKIEEETQTWLQRLRDEAYVEYRLEE